MRVPSAPSNALIAFMFVLQGARRQLVNVFRYNRTDAQVSMMVHGSWLVLNMKPSAYLAAIRFFGIDGPVAKQEAKICASALATYSRDHDSAIIEMRRIWDARLTLLPLCVPIPADIGLDQIETNLNLTDMGQAVSITNIKVAGQSIDAWIVEKRGTDNAMISIERFTLGDKNAAFKTWEGIKKHEGIDSYRLTGAIRPEEELHTALEHLQAQQAKQVERALSQERTKQEEARIRQERAEEEKREREKEIERVRAAAALERERREALKHKELLGKDVEKLNNDDYANRMRARRATRTS